MLGPISNRYDNRLWYHHKDPPLQHDLVMTGCDCEHMMGTLMIFTMLASDGNFVHFEAPYTGAYSMSAKSCKSYKYSCVNKCALC